MREIKAVICGYYGKGNAGDEALLMSLLQMLPTQITPLVLSANPGQTSQDYGVKSYQRWNILEVLKAINQSQIFIWGGGSLMQDVTSLASPLYYGSLMALAQQRGLKTIAWAQGIGPLKHPLTQTITKIVLSNCDAISVRDDKSAKLLLDWQISSIIAPDPVWALNSKPVKGIADLHSPRVAVNLRPHPQLTPHLLTNLTKALRDFQQATNCSILLVPFQASQDLEIAHHIASHISQNVEIVNLSNPSELKGLFRGVEMLIGMRFHSLIMAASENCRCFALSYDPKVSQLMKQLNLEGWELTQIPDNPSLITNNWLKFYANGDSLTKTQVQSLVDRALIHQELLKQFVVTEG